MTIKKSSLHPGERDLQARRGTPRDLADRIPDYISASMPSQHAAFYCELPYLPLATLDNLGRPWASLLVTKTNVDSPSGIKLNRQNKLEIVCDIAKQDPFARAVSQTSVGHPATREAFAGVGIDFTNRRRNKLAGNIDLANVDASGKMHLVLDSNAHLGNCPKYITVRNLEPFPRRSSVIFDHFEQGCVVLPEASRQLIEQASTVFLATKHQPEAPSPRSLGLNHRGGAPGFVRVYDEWIPPSETSPHRQKNTLLVLPDYSGNRFYQSLGNVQSNKEVGLTFANFTTGDMLFITGEADNLFDEEADAIMPRMSLVTRVRITGAVHINQALNLKLEGEEQLSPYNPPIRYLREELMQRGHQAHALSPGSEVQKARLISVQKRSQTISTFTFQLSHPIDVALPGGFGIFDFSEHLDSGYQHMNEADPQAINDDFVRTWTLSSAPDFDAVHHQFKKTDSIDITVKCKPGGSVSQFLHDVALSQSVRPEFDLEVPLKGVGAGFSCFTHATDKTPPHIPPNMLWVAGGVGITPFMSMWDGLLRLHKAYEADKHSVATNIRLFFAARGDDVACIRHFLNDSALLPQGLSLSISVFHSGDSRRTGDHSLASFLNESGRDVRLQMAQRRMQATDFKTVPNLKETEIFMCGPSALMTLTEDAINARVGHSLKIQQESYLF